jgi:hypothetical protein
MNQETYEIIREKIIYLLSRYPEKIAIGFAKDIHYATHRGIDNAKEVLAKMLTSGELLWSNNKLKLASITPLKGNIVECFVRNLSYQQYSCPPTKIIIGVIGSKLEGGAYLVTDLSDNCVYKTIGSFIIRILKDEVKDLF